MPLTDKVRERLLTNDVNYYQLIYDDRVERKDTVGAGLTKIRLEHAQEQLKEFKSKLN